MSSYSFEDHAKSYAIKALDIKSGHSKTLYDSSALTEPTWISNTEFLLIKNNEKSTSLLVADVTKPDSEYVLGPPLELSLWFLVRRLQVLT